MNFRTKLLTVCFSVAVAYAASADLIVIGNGVQNGFFTDTTNPTSATGETISTNTSGRALVNTSATGDSIEIANWAATREAYSSANAAFGWDAAAGRTVGDTPYAFVNSGDVLFTADPVSGAFGIGDMFNLSFGTYVQDARANHEVDATLTFDSGEIFTSTLVAGDNTGDMDFFNQDFTLTQAASSATLSLRVKADLGQFTMDNVQLTYIPEPSTLALIGIGLLGMALRRRR